MPTIVSQPARFNYTTNTVLANLVFAIPSGVWLGGFWTREYIVNANEAPGVRINTGSANFAVFPTLFGPSSGSNTIAVTANQLIDINAAAGGGLSAQYGRPGPDSDASTTNMLSFTLTLYGAPGGGSMRFERATVYEGFQLGVETTPGVGVPANKRLLGLEVDFDNMTDIKPYRPQGNKFNTAQQLGKEWTSGRIQGIQCYNDMIYLASSWLTTTTPITPSASPIWNVSGASGPWGFTYKGSTLVPATFASAAAAQAAIGAMPSVGPGNVVVTGAAPTFTIQFVGALSTDTSAITTPAGTPAPTITNAGVGTLTRRWPFVMAPAGPDSVVTFSMEKGVQGVANMAQQSVFGFVNGLAFKFTKAEASLSGEFAGQTTTDPYTMTASPTDVPCIPVNMKDVSVYAGTTLNSMVLLDRILEMDFGVNSRASGLITLNANDASFSNRIETAPDLTCRFFQEHDAAGQVMLGRMRSGTDLYVIVEATGPSIETGFNYRMKWTMKMGIIKPNPGDVDGAYGRNYDAVLKYDSVLGTAIKLEIDSPLSAL